MASKAQMTGMLGTYLTAAELTFQGLIVSITSRNARGADLLVTTQDCSRAWSVQVKTNRKAVGFWLLSKHYSELSSATHIYVFVNLRGDEKPDYYVVPSKVVGRLGVTKPPRSTGSTWYSFYRKDAAAFKDKWSVFK